MAPAVERAAAEAVPAERGGSVVSVEDLAG